MDQRISMVTLGVADLDRARRFYTEGLGWKPSGGEHENVVFFQIGGSVFGLYPREALAEDANTTANEGSGFGGIALAQNTHSREEVDETLKEAEAAGGRILKPAGDTFWGGYSGYFADPDGHLWEIAWNPFWQLEEDGSMKLPVS